MSQRKRNRQHHHPLHVESLESRELMAGDVTAFVSGNTLFVNEASKQAGGDNGILVSRTSSGLIRITGDSPASGGSFSKVNGNAFAQFRGPIGGLSLVVNLGAGNDQVTFSDATPTLNSVTLNLGAPPPVSTQTLPLIGPGTFFQPPDADEVNIQGARVLGSMSINTGPQVDNVFMGNFQIGGNLSINTGAGDDSVFLQTTAGKSQSSVNGALSVQTFDSLSEVNVDNVFLTGLGVRNDIQVRAGHGDDVIHLDNTTSQKVIDIAASQGNDSVTLRSLSAVDGIMARMGSGDDTLLADRLTGLANLQGETGIDRLTISNVSQRVLSGWEFINGRRTSLFNPIIGPILSRA